jgi:hypothetical protein
MSYLNTLRQWVEALKDLDVKVFMGGAGAYVLFDESATQLVLSGVALVEQAAIVAETTTSRTVTSADYGKIIQVSNASACTVTLPAPAAGNVGAKVTVQTRTDAAHVVSLAEKITGLANLTGDTLTAAETNKIGQVVTLVSDGSTWNVISMLGAWTLGDT